MQNYSMGPMGRTDATPVSCCPKEGRAVQGMQGERGGAVQGRPGERPVPPAQPACKESLKVQTTQPHSFTYSGVNTNQPTCLWSGVRELRLVCLEFYPQRLESHLDFGQAVRFSLVVSTADCISNTSAGSFHQPENIPGISSSD